jgi:hypothetical protein
MKLFDMAPEEKRGLRRFLAWHAGYALYVCLLFFILYRLDLFKSRWFLEEAWILNLWAPLHTIVFVFITPYRRDWGNAMKRMYRSLDGDPVFCVMALLVFGVGFYLYSLIIWLAGALLPSILFN